MAASPKVAFVFPGQGAHRAGMLDAVRHLPSFAHRYACVCDALGVSLEVEMQRDDTFVDRNIVSSLLTVLVSSLSLDAYRKTLGRNADFVSGYSVGQWTALYAAGCLSFDQLVSVIQTRAGLMDVCLAGTQGAMIAVIGVSRDRIEAFCQQMQSQGHEIVIGNYNSPGQYSLSGTADAVEIALGRIKALSPKIARRLPVSGAWHSPLLQPAARAFQEHLESVALRLPLLPIMSDTTGAFLPASIAEIKTTLARHVSSPVLWEQGIRSLIDRGCRTFVELGFGTTLSKFGFFIDRSVTHRSFLLPDSP